MNGRMVDAWKDRMQGKGKNGREESVRFGEVARWRIGQAGRQAGRKLASQPARLSV